MQRRTTFLLGLLLTAVALSTANKLANGPVWDDVHLLGLVGQLQARGALSSVFTHSMLDLVFEGHGAHQLDLYRPVGLASFALVQALDGVAAQHLCNTALHLSCAWLVYAHARRLLPEAHAGWSLAPAAVFGLTPVLTEAHVWISGRFDLCATAFGLASVLLWRDALSSPSSSTRVPRLMAAALLFLLGLLAKESLLFALPALYFYPFARHRFARQRLAALLPLALPGAAYLALRMAMLGGVGTDLSPQQLGLAALNLPSLLLDAALNALVPTATYPRVLSEDYASLGVVGRMLLGVLAAGLALFLFGARKRLPVLAWSGLWLLCTLAPAALVTAHAWPGFGRFLYLPSSLWLVGLSAAAQVAHRASAEARLWRVLKPAGVLYLCVLAVTTHAVTFDWADDETLFGAVLARAPERSHGYGLLGMTMVEQRRFPEAVTLLRKARAIAPEHRGYASQLGTALLFAGDKAEALALARGQIARLRSPTEFHLLAAYAQLDDDPGASAAHVLECLKLDADHPQCQQSLRFLWSEHPRAARFREALQQLFAQSRYAQLSALVAAAGDRSAPWPP